MKSILVPGDGSTTSREVRDIARSIAPKKSLTHQDVKAFVAANHPEVKIVKANGGSGVKYPKYKFEDVRLVSASEVAEKADLLLFAVIWEEWEATTEHVKWDRDVSIEHPDIERAISGFAGERRVLVIKIRRRRMEAAYSAAVAAFQVAEDCKNVAKISFVAGPFGMGTICVLAPGPNDDVVYDMFEVDGEGVIKTKVGLPNRRFINWTYKLLGDTKLPFRLQRIPLVTGRARIATSVELPTPLAMYEWEVHGLLEACQVMERSTADFTVIGLVVDNLKMKYVHNKNREDSKEELKAFLKRAFEEDGFFFTA